MKDYRKLMLYLIGWTILSLSIYITLLYMQIKEGFLIYELLAGGLIAAYVIINKGIKTKKPDWDAPAAEIKRYNLGKKLLLLALPLIFIVMIDFLALSFGYNFADLFSSTVSK